MRIVLLLLFISTGITAAAQDNLSRQLQLIIKDTTTHFRKFKGSFKVGIITDSLFNSAMTIEGTKANEVDISDNGVYYFAHIIDSANTETANRLFDQWMSKLTKALGPSFKGKEGQPHELYKSSHVKMYIFSHARLNITLNHSLNPNNSKLHDVRLSFFYLVPLPDLNYLK